MGIVSLLQGDMKKAINLIELGIIQNPAGISSEMISNLNVMYELAQLGADSKKRDLGEVMNLKNSLL